MLQITTPYGDRFIIHGNGDIERTDLPGFKTSGNWKMLGLQHVKKNRFIPLKDIPDFLKNSPSILWKNGNPQWTVRVLDHGTTAEWGNTKFHGIASIREIETHP